MGRNYLIAGNWKMNNGAGTTASFFNELAGKLENVPNQVEMLICPPFVSLTEAVEAAKQVDGMQVGAQNLHYEDNGAYTGEISAVMIKDAGCSHVIIGHSERREYFGETDQIIGKKIMKALANGLTPVFCVGEVLGERKSGDHFKVVETQVLGALSDMDSSEISKIVVAYEPVWAIGTGETATPEQAQEMHAFIRKVIGNKAGNEVASGLRILYGGSMKPDNAADLLGRDDVDGGLIGGASLKADSFAAIVQAATKLV
ncbi:MAG: triose-phosphate isomerase [Cyclonatronaceae bacterium]